MLQSELLRELRVCCGFTKAVQFDVANCIFRIETVDRKKRAGRPQKPSKFFSGNE